MERVKIFRPASFSTAEIRKIAAAADSDYTIIYTRPTELKFVNFGIPCSLVCLQINPFAKSIIFFN